MVSYIELTMPKPYKINYVHGRAYICYIICFPGAPSHDRFTSPFHHHRTRNTSTCVLGGGVLEPTGSEFGCDARECSRYSKDYM